MSEFIRQFGIDWKLLVAQAVNFTVLLFLLKRFAYRPILDMLRTRQKKITEGIEMRKEAEEHLARIDALRRDAERESRQSAMEVVKKAEQTARQKQEQTALETHAKVEMIIADAKRAIEGERLKMREQATMDAKTVIREGIALVLGKMPPHDRDDALIDEAIRELAAMKK